MNVASALRYALTAALVSALVTSAPALAADPPRTKAKIVVRKINESGGYILRMQQALAEMGYDPGTLDGIYGKATDEAVKQYLADRAARRPVPAVAAAQARAAEEKAQQRAEAEAQAQAEQQRAEEARAEAARAEQQRAEEARAEAARAEQQRAEEARAGAAPAAEGPVASTQSVHTDTSEAMRADRVAGDTVAQLNTPTPVPTDPPVDNTPVMSPFTGPADGRPMSPPASMAGIGLEDSLSGLEGTLLTEAVVTTSSKRAQRLQDVPMTVDWIPGEELEGTGQFSLCEAIQYFPGMECRRGAMRKVAVSARGLGNNFLSNRLLLLQDGRPQTDPWTGQFYADETTPVTNVKQIEVIRGPGSSLYGSNAFSGVINVIRRSPSDLMTEERPYGFEARVLGGQFETFRGQATAAGRAGPVEGLVNYYGFRSDGDNLLGNPATGVVDDQEWTRVHQVSGIVDIGKVVRLDVDYTNAALGRPGGNQISAVGTCGRCHYTPNDAEFVQNLNANAQVDLRVNENVRLFGQGYALFKRREVAQENAITGGFRDALGKRNRYGGELRALFSLGDTLNVTAGGDVKQDVVNNLNVLASALDPQDEQGLLTQTILGGYVDAEFRPVGALVLGGGVRYDHYLIPSRIWQNPSAQISPRASIVYHAVERLVTLRTNYGRAFRAPTLAELAINQQMYASTLIGNPNLRAETLDTVEAAVDFWPFEGKARFTATGFYNLARNFINQEHVGGSTSQFFNIGDAQVVGFEAEAAAQVKEINSSFNVAYQFLHAQSLATEGRVAAPLDYAPNHRVYFRGRTNIGSTAFVEMYAVWVSERFDPSVQGDAHQRVKLDPYLSANARVGVNISRGLSLSMIGSNIFNSRHQESFGFPVQGASLFGELRYTH